MEDPSPPRQLENLFMNAMPNTSYAPALMDDDENELPYDSCDWKENQITSASEQSADSLVKEFCVDDDEEEDPILSTYKKHKTICASEDLSKSGFLELMSAQNSFEKSFQSQKFAPKLAPLRKPVDRDWTREFIGILHKSPLDRGAALATLSTAFRTTARAIAETIVLESGLPYHEQTIRPPPDQKGRAGGLKFFHNGIFFKFAVDSFRIYGGDKYARKACGLELASMNALTPAGLMLGLSFPLTCIIDFLGHRIIAQSVLPIDSGTLVYGSENRGRVVVASDPKMNEIMKQLGQMKCIKPHRVGQGDAAKELYGPLDIEGHRGTDRYYYLCDVARYFPPESPVVFPDAASQGYSSQPTGRRLQTCYLYRQLRPELLQAYSHPLSSDAYSPFGSHERFQHEEEVKLATQFLFSQVIPDVAAKLDKLSSPAQLGLDKQRTSTDGSNSCGLTQFMHTHGVNVRWMGLVYRYMTNDAIRIFVLQEMICRVLKGEIQAALRASGSLRPETLTPLALKQFNLIFCGQPEIWLRIRDLLVLKFEGCLSEDDSTHWFHLRSRLNMFHLFQVLQLQTGIFFHPSSAAALKRHFSNLRQTPNSHHMPFDASMIQELRSTVKIMQLLPRIEADSLYIQAQSQKQNPKEAVRLYKLAMQSYESSLKLNPSDAAALANLGNVLVGLGQLRYPSSPEDAERFFMDAHERFKMALEINRSNISSLRSWINAIHAHMDLFISFTARPRILGLFSCLDTLYARLVSITRALQHDHSSRQLLLADYLGKWGASRLQQARFLRKCADLSSVIARIESILLRAQELLEESMKLDDQNIDANINLGVVLMDMALLGDASQSDLLFSRAFSIFTVVEEMDGGRGKASYNLACLYGILIKANSRGDVAVGNAGSDYTRLCRKFLQQSLEYHTMPRAMIVQSDPDLVAINHHKWFQNIVDQRAKIERGGRRFFS